MEHGTESYRRYLQGDESGFTELVREYKDGLTLYLAAIVGDLHTAEELAEDTFVRLGFRRPRDRGTASFRTWLYTIGRRLAIDWLRRNRHRNEPSGLSAAWPDADADPEQQYLRAESSRRLHRAMAQLPAGYRQALWLYYFEQLSTRETAIAMGRTLHATEMLLSRARLSLKSVLEQEGYTHEDL